jgi:alpha-beta hydrolase superfamily lysophospholipase
MKFSRFRNFLIVTLGLAGAIYALYRLIFRLLEKGMLKTRPAGLATPADSGLSYEDLAVQSGGRRLQAWFVPADASSAAGKAVLIYHGIDETIADWIPALVYLHEHGFSTMVFDYSGFGNSQGQAAIVSLRQDAQAAYAAFLTRIPGAAKKIVLGYSLGTGVLLDAASAFGAPPDELVLAAAYSSGREAAVQMGALPARLAFVIPDVFNNVQAVQRLNIPLLVIHSQDDQLFPTWMPAKIYAAAAEPKRLVILEGLKHGDMLEGKAGEYLAPLVETDILVE